MSAVIWPMIEITSDGTAVVEGTRTKIIEIALDRLAHHWDADEIQRQHPYLSLAQIHAALAYYYDHQAELDALIRQQLQLVAELRRGMENVALVQKLTAGDNN